MIYYFQSLYLYPVEGNAILNGQIGLFGLIVWLRRVWLLGFGCRVNLVMITRPNRVGSSKESRKQIKRIFNSHPSRRMRVESVGQQRRTTKAARRLNYYEDLDYSANHGLPIPLLESEFFELYEDDIGATESGWDEFYKAVDEMVEKSYTDEGREELGNRPGEVGIQDGTYLYGYKRSATDLMPTGASEPKRVKLRQEERERVIRKFFGFDWFRYQLIVGDEIKTEAEQFLYDRIGGCKLSYNGRRGGQVYNSLGEVLTEKDRWGGKKPGFEWFSFLRCTGVRNRFFIPVWWNSIRFTLLFGLQPACFFSNLSWGVGAYVGAFSIVILPFMFYSDLTRFSLEDDDGHIDETLLDAFDKRMWRRTYLFEVQKFFKYANRGGTRVEVSYSSIFHKTRLDKINVARSYNRFADLASTEMVFYKAEKGTNEEQRFFAGIENYYYDYIVDPLRKGAYYEGPMWPKIVALCKIYVLYLKWWYTFFSESWIVDWSDKFYWTILTYLGGKLFCLCMYSSCRRHVTGMVLRIIGS